MNLPTASLGDNPINAKQPTFLERWVAGTYLVTGIFPTDGRELTIERMIAAMPSLYTTTRANKQARWPRGLCGYFLVPIYTAPSFDPGVVEWVHSFHPYRWAIWHVPVLYHTATNAVDKRVYGDPRSDKYHHYGSTFRPYLENVIGSALRAVAQPFGHQLPETVNGLPIQKTTSG